MKSMVAPESVSRFLEGARQGIRVLSSVREEMDRKLARRFSPFSYFDLSENRMSDILADLLRPEGTHGQGSLFVDCFSGQMFEEEKRRGADIQKWTFPEKLDVLSVDREALTTRIDTGSRRIDIEIAFEVNGETACVAIENKPQAEDQDRQIAAYSEHLHKKIR